MHGVSRRLGIGWTRLPRFFHSKSKLPLYRDSSMVIVGIAGSQGSGSSEFVGGVARAAHWRNSLNNWQSETNGILDTMTAGFDLPRSHVESMKRVWDSLADRRQWRCWASCHFIP